MSREEKPKIGAKKKYPVGGGGRGSTMVRCTLVKP
jgi:hypothetical protein